MKRLFLALSLVLIASVSVFAQGPTGQIVRTIPLDHPYGPLIAQATGLSTSRYQECTNPGELDSFTSGIVTYNFPSGAPNAVTMTLSGSTNGRTFSTITTGTTTTGGSLAFSSVYTAVCITATTMTGSGVTVQGVIQGISDIGSVTIDPTGLATSANQTNASQKTQVVDGSGNVIGATSNALDVNIKSGGATGVAQGSTTSGQLGTLTQGAVTTSAPTYTTAQTDPVSIDVHGGLRATLQTAAGVAIAAVTDPCDGVAATTTAIGSSATIIKIIAKTSAKTNYVCGGVIVLTTAAHLSIVEGTHGSADCDTATVALLGSTTAGNGIPLAANSGFIIPKLYGTGTNLDMCIVIDGSAQIMGGGVNWIQP